MSKNTSFRRRQRQRVGLGARFFWLIIGLALGYVTTIVLDASALTGWMQSFNKKPSAAADVQQKSAQKGSPPVKPKFEFYTLLSKDNHAPPVVNHSPAALSSAMPHQKTLELQPQAVTKATVLAERRQTTPLELTLPLSAQKEVKVIPKETKATVMNTKSAVKDIKKDKSSNFVIQIAAFNKIKDAEHLKATLVLTGFNASISSVQRQNVLWYRVSIGPFVSLSEAKKAQNIVLKEEHMRGIIRQG